MSDFDGESAFNIVLDRLFESETGQHGLREQLGDAQGATRRIQADRDRLANMLVDRDRELGELRKLRSWHALKTLKADLLAEGRWGAPWVKDETVAAVEAAIKEDDPDEIPF